MTIARMLNVCVASKPGVQKRCAGNPRFVEAPGIEGDTHAGGGIMPTDGVFGRVIRGGVATSSDEIGLRS